ncbi:MAG: GNAT family N-acetyltransferase [Actinomycetota bacterium]|nr:GNAT family N-acetyltransferase [Actinomycetota bacterium]
MSSREIATARLVLRGLDAAHVDAVVTGARRPDWAPDFPDEGDVLIARMVAAVPGADPDDLWGHRSVVERSSGLVVGGAGFHGPPADGVVEVGYGIVASRRGRGYATEAVGALLRLAWSVPDVARVCAQTSPGNVASARVLENSGMVLQDATADGLRYAVERPQGR